MPDFYNPDGTINFASMGNWGALAPVFQQQSTPSTIPMMQGTPTIFPGQYGMPNVPGTGGNPQSIWGKLGDVLGSDKFNTGVSAFSNLANIYMGFKSLGLAKDQLSFAKSSFRKNFRAQAQAYNNELRDRWESRSAAHATRGRDYQGMDEWMAPRQISG